jgi:hypothetical protein
MTQIRNTIGADASVRKPMDVEVKLFNDRDAPPRFGRRKGLHIDKRRREASKRHVLT